MILTGLLAALKFAPAVFSAGASIFESVTGEKVSADETPDSLATKIEGLPEKDRAAITQSVLAFQAEAQKLDTQRFLSMNDGDAEKVRASARPEIARQAMSRDRGFRLVFQIDDHCHRRGLGSTVYIRRCGCSNIPLTESIWDLMAAAEPVTEMIWPPLIASLGVCASVIKKYMGCRERDKAQQFEMMAGRPLNSAAATVEAAGSGLASLIKAVRG